MQIKLASKNRFVSVYLDGKLICQQKYLADAGDIVGLRYSFLGAGEIEYITLSSSTGKKFYDEHFTK